MPMEAEKVAVNAAELRYIEQGSGIPIVFVHGSLTDFRTWAFQMESFRKCYHAIAISRRYHYPNDFVDAGWDYSAINHAEDLAAFIEMLGIAPAHIVGHSYGAFACAILATQHPELVRSLVLCEPPIISLLDAVPGGKSMIANFMDEIWKPVEKAFRKGGSKEGVKIFIDGIQGAGTFDKLPATAVDRIMDNAPAMKAQAMATDQYPVFTCKDVQRIEKPVLLVAGEGSHKMLHVILNELERCLQNSKIVMIPNASHNMYAANPHAFNEVVRDFLAKM